MNLMKYPRTRHLTGSRLQPGDQDLSQVRLAEVAEVYMVVEEKIDGANAAISFDPEAGLRLQSRGHFLSGGAREKHFTLFKTWANAHRASLQRLLGTRYLMFGEWVYARHTIYYDALTHYFLEFDMYDREQEIWLDTPSRHGLLAGSPIISVPVIGRGLGKELAPFPRWIGRSHFQTENWREALLESARARGLDEQRVLLESDRSGLMEGLYLKLEANGQTVGRLKWVRADFLTTVVESGTHWLDRPIVPNRLAEGADLFSIGDGQ